MRARTARLANLARLDDLRVSGARPVEFFLTGARTPCSID